MRQREERTVVGAVLSLFLVTVTLYDSRTIWSRGTEKTCRKLQHVKRYKEKTVLKIICKIEVIENIE